LVPTSLDSKIALVTGASRGIGAATARVLAEQGADVVVNYRSKRPRAEEIARQVGQLGRRALAVQADLTDRSELERMATEISARFGRLDILILNASGGLEKDRPASYAHSINVTAQVDTVAACLPLMPPGGTIVFVTSHWAHFHGEKPVAKVYEPVAASKRAGEEALRAQIPRLDEHGIRLLIVSGDVIDGTITPKLLDRAEPGLLESRRETAGLLPTVEEFARAIVAAAADSQLPSGHTSFVGATE
jgi:NAD(P)-dependent dehydrogenase (short-subunit alcohol dehydrogenase family)